jgi:hypothetical protein
VVKISIEFTVHFSPLNSPKSPILYGLNIKIITPAAKLDNDHCSASPTASHAAHKIAINEVVSIPTMPAADTNNMILSRILTMFLIKRCNHSSICAVWSHLRIILLINFIAVNPANSTIIARIRRGQYTSICVIMI